LTKKYISQKTQLHSEVMSETSYHDSPDQLNPDFSIKDIHAEENEIVIKTGGVETRYSVNNAMRIKDDLDKAIKDAVEE